MHTLLPQVFHHYLSDHLSLMLANKLLNIENLQWGMHSLIGHCTFKLQSLLVVHSKCWTKQVNSSHFNSHIEAYMYIHTFYTCTCNFKCLLLSLLEEAENDKEDQLNLGLPCE